MIHPRLLRIALVLGLLAVALGGWAWWQAGRSAQAREGVAPRVCALPPQAADAPHPGMVWVPGGVLDFGDTVYPEEGPLRQVPVSGFWMDRTEVTNAQFAEFVRATGYVTVAERPVDARTHPGLPADMLKPGAVVFTMPNAVNGRGDVTQWWRYTPGASWRHPGGPDTDLQGREAFPVVALTYEDAAAFARWKGRSLPSEVQWEWAARAARPGKADGTGDQPPKEANTWQGLFPVQNSGDDGFVGLAPVGCYAPNALGLHDLLGNVWEITRDPWTPDHGAPPLPPELLPPQRPGPGQQRVIKGGSYLCAPSYCMRYRAGARQPQEDDLAMSHLGFRTILVAPGP